MPELMEAVPNFSEGRDAALLDRLRGPDALDQHADAAHNRCVVTLVETDPGRLVAGLVERTAAALDGIDLRRHRGLHPRVGVADVLPVVPLDGTEPARAELVARELAGRLWERCRVPVWFYGSLAGGRRLADLRRLRDPGRPGASPPFDVGDRPHPSGGVCCVGARPPLVAYNLTLARPRAEVVAVLPALRSLPGVLALAFPLGEGRTQLSMNLTEPARTGVEEVASEVRRLLGEAGEPELVGLCPAHAAGPGCDGGLLEARLIAAGASGVARAAFSRPDPEARRLGERLGARAGAIAALPARPEAMLGAAEEAIALLRLMPTVGSRDERSRSCLLAGARGLRRAVGQATPVLARRLDLLDHWLGIAARPVV